MIARSRPGGITALSVFFVFGATMSGMASLMLLFPGSALEPLWSLNPRAREGLLSMGPWSVVLMLIVCAACVGAALGLWRLKRWGYRMALAILTVNLIGDTGNALFANDWRTLIGLPIGGALILYLLSNRRLFLPAS